VCGGLEVRDVCGVETAVVDTGAVVDVTEELCVRGAPTPVLDTSAAFCL